MKYRIYDGKGDVLIEDTEEDEIENTIKLMSSRSKSLILMAQLPISLTAKVIRKRGEPELVRIEYSGKSFDLLRDGDRQSGEPELVRIEYSGKSFDLLRDGDRQSGDIFVSCSPIGKEVPVDSFNIRFRHYNDEFTDRGVVWLFPGNPANIYLVIKRKALEVPDRVKAIIKDAKSALKIKLLDKIELSSDESLSNLTRFE